MSKNLGFAVYVSTFKQQLPMLEKLKGRNFPIFTSLHIGEEVSDTYVTDVEEMCDWLHQNDFYILADVSPYTLKRFEEPSLASLVKRLHINNLRLDFGFDAQNLSSNLKDIDLTYNASTTLGEINPREDASYMHNFYPRPETGLDVELFTRLNQRIKKIGGKTLAFISGDREKRGPIFEGLPTLEHHRYLAPYAQYIDLIRTYEMDVVYLGDLSLTDQQLEFILSYLEDDLIRLPVNLEAEYRKLYKQKFTVRVDSPKGLIRVQESREFAQAGKATAPDNTNKRPRGTITIDNERYKRYSGEVQIMKDDYPADERVNVIGRLAKEHHLLLDNLKNGEQFLFVPEK
jgi:hypothetical protein